MCITENINFKDVNDVKNNTLIGVILKVIYDSIFMYRFGNMQTGTLNGECIVTKQRNNGRETRG